MQKKILHIIIKSRYDGVTAFSVRLCSALPKYDHYILACYKGNASVEVNKMKIHCTHLLNRERISYKSLLLKYFQAIIFFIKNSFDVIHYHHGGTGVLLIAVLFRKKAKVIYHLHGGNLIVDNTKQDISFIHSVLMKLISKFTYQIAVAAHVYNEYSQKIKNTSRLKVIRNAVPYHFRKKELIKNGLGYIGRFDNNKGYRTFVSVSSKINMEFSGINFFTMGDKPDKEYNFISFLNPSFSIEQFYENIDLFLFPSTGPEGLPLVVLEAIAFDVGVIAHPLKGVVEILGDDYPLYFNSDDELLLKVKRFYSDDFDRKHLSEIHRQRLSEFKFEEMINKINLLYNS